MHALGLMAVLVELIAQRGHRDHQCADDEIKDVGAVHIDFGPNGLSIQGK